MKKKLISICLAAVLATAVLTACSESAGGTAEQTAEAEDAAKEDAQAETPAEDAAPEEDAAPVEEAAADETAAQAGTEAAAAPAAETAAAINLIGEDKRDQVPAEGAGMMPAAGANPAERAFQEEYAARAQWCAHDWDECNHAPVISDVAPDVAAAPGQVVELFATATDPDGDALRVCWHYDHLASSYAGTADNLRAFEPAHLRTRAVVPVDARRGDRLVWTLEVQDVADRPLTRYAQVAVTVG